MEVNYSIGELVRVANLENDVANVGMISYLESSTCDVLYPNLNFFIKNVEENDVSLARISKLEQFEVDGWKLANDLNDLFSSAFSDVEGDAYLDCLTSAKDKANTLYAAKDVIAAEAIYSEIVLEISKRNLINIGSNVIVLPPIQPNHQSTGHSRTSSSILDFPVGTVSYVDEEQSDQPVYEVILDSIVDGDEEISVSLDRLVAIGLRTSKVAADCRTETMQRNLILGVDLQRAVHINLCRCSLKLKRPVRAIRHSSLALILARFVNTVNDEHGGRYLSSTRVLKGVADALVLRVRALLLVNRPGLARRDALTLGSLDSSRGDSLLMEVSAFIAKRKTEDRKLARNVARWVDEAVSRSENIKPTSTEAGSDDRFELDDMCDEDDVDTQVTGMPRGNVESDDSKCILA